MISKTIILIANLLAIVQAGYENPPSKSQAYSVPSVAKVSYPAPTITKSVETYSAPSIEKTTTITRTITAPINAPAVKSVQYSAPHPPVHHQQDQFLYNAPAFPAPGYGAPQFISGYEGSPKYSAPQGYQIVAAVPSYHQKVASAPEYQLVAQPPTYQHQKEASPVYGAPLQKGYGVQGLSLGVPSFRISNAQPALSNHGHRQGVKLATYTAPSLGYSLGEHQPHSHSSGQLVSIKGGAYGY